MQVVIICGGGGSRLKKKYKNTPKALIKFNKKPNLEYQIYQLKKNGITDFLFLTNHLNEKITHYVKKLNLKKYRILNDHDYFGAAGSLIGSKKFLQEEFIVLYSDIFIEFNFKKFLNFVRAKNSECAVVVQSNSHPFDSDTVEFDKNCLINKITFKNTKSQKINNATASIFYFKKRILKNISYKKNTSMDITRDILPRLIKNKKVYAYKTIEYLNDFGTWDRLNDVKYSLKNGQINNLILDYKKTAVFLDRDGVINRELGIGVKSIKDFKIIPNAGKAIAKLNLNNIPCFLVSNQSVLAKKQITLNEFKKIIMYLDEYLSKYKAYIDDFLICANYKNIKYNDKNASFFSKFRKPNPGMILTLAKKYNINLKKSYLIGDSETDILAGKLSNLTTILVKSIKTKTFKLKIKPDYKVKNLYEAVNLILKKR